MAGGILETFYFLFESDASKVDKGLKEAREKNQKFGNELLQTDKVASKLGQGFVDMVKTGAAALTAALAVSSIRHLAEESADATNEIRLMAKASFKGVEDFSAYSGAVRAAGGSTEAFASTLKNLGMVTNQPLNYMMRLARMFNGLSDKRAMRLASWIGIDPGLVPFLQQGEQGIKRLIDRQLELGIVTKHQADVAKSYKDQLRDTNQVYDDIKRRIATAILPYMTEWLKLLEVTVRWLRDNKTFTMALFIGLAAVITAVFLPAILSATAATIAFLLPWVLIGAAIAAVGAAIAFVYDDVKAFLAGNKSVIGELSKKWPELGVAVRKVAAVIGDLWDMIKEFAQFVINIFTKGFTAAWEEFKNQASETVDKIGEKFPLLGALIKALAVPIGYIVDFFNQHWETIADTVEGVWNVIYAVLQMLSTALMFIADLISDGPEAAFKNMGERSQAIIKDLIGEFPALQSAMQSVADTIGGVLDTLSLKWDDLKEGIKAVINTSGYAAEKLGQAWKSIKGLAGSDENPAPTFNNVQSRAITAQAQLVAPPEQARQLADMLAKANSSLANTVTPLNTMSSSSILNSTKQDQSKKTDVNIQEVNFNNTTPMDPAAMSQSFANDFARQLQGAIDEHDDGNAA